MLCTGSFGGDEEAMEQDMIDILDQNLGKGYEIESLEISDSIHITDKKCKEFKRQIKDNFKYDMAEKAVEKVMDKTEGKDKPVDEKTVKAIDEDISKKQEEIIEKSEE
jgi:hypothetical protein